MSTIGLAQEGLEVLYMVDSMDEYSVQELKEVNGKTFKSTKSAGLGLDDENCKKLSTMKEESRSPGCARRRLDGRGRSLRNSGRAWTTSREA